MATLTEQSKTAALDRGELLRALRAFKNGDFSVRMPSELDGVDGAIARAFNDVAAASAAHAAAEARLIDQAFSRDGAGDL